MVNPPEAINKIFNDAPARMQYVDKLIGRPRLDSFAQTLSSLLSHAEPEGSSIVGVIKDSSTQAEIVVQIMNAATELEMGWNAIRLVNVPAAQRQGRVASELIAGAALMAIPFTEIAALPRSVPLARCLQDHPGKTVIDCYTPILQVVKGIQVFEPLLKATDFFSSFVDVAQTALAVPADELEIISSYRKYVQHPASHGSAELFMYHFEGFGESTGKAGAVLDAKRSQTLILAAEELIAVTRFLTSVLDRVTQHLLSGVNSGAG